MNALRRRPRYGKRRSPTRWRKVVVRAERAVDVEILIGDSGIVLACPSFLTKYADQLPCPCIPKTGRSVDGNDCYKAAVATAGKAVAAIPSDRTCARTT